MDVVRRSIAGGHSAARGPAFVRTSGQAPSTRESTCSSSALWRARRRATVEFWSSWLSWRIPSEIDHSRGALDAGLPAAEFDVPMNYRWTDEKEPNFGLLGHGLPVSCTSFEREVRCR